jgi:ABC-type Fe3+-hydroxamate transport system substrate-binding protein
MNDEENRREDADALVAAGLDVLVLTVESVADVHPALERLADRVGVTYEAPALPAPRPAHVRAFVPIWRRPWMTMNQNTYGSSVLAAIGVGNVFAGHGDRYPTTSLDEAAALRPDVVLAPSEPYVFGEKHVPELSAVAPVELVDGQDLFWWGARTFEAIERLGSRLERITA